jgi:hypothetical protein
VTYDGNAHTATATATGAGGVTLGAADFTLTGTTHTNVGTYASDAWSFTDPNYVGASGTVSDTISKATATITVTPYSVTYDGNAHTATATATGAGGANLAADLNLTGTAHTNVGTYPSDPWSFSDATGNYNNTSGTVSDSIAKATATINITPYNVIYDGNPHTATGTATGAGGANLNADLNLTGTTHTAIGNYASDPWTFTDATGNYNSASGTVDDTINATLAIQTTTLSPAYVYTGSSYSQTLTAVGGASPYTWSVIAGGLSLANAGLSLGSSTGLTDTVSGNVPSSATTGPFTFTVQVKDSNGVTASQQYPLTVYGVLSLPTPNPSSLGPATISQLYNGTILASGGSGSYSWTVTGLPSDSLGYSSSGNTLTISGTPLLAAPASSPVTFNVTVTDTTTSKTTGPVQYTIAVNPPTPLTLPASGALNGATTNQVYSGAVNASGGSGSGYVFTVNGTQIPTTGALVAISDSISVSNTGGNTLSIGGTPTTTGTVTLTNVTVKDGANDTAGPDTYTIAVNPPTPLTLPASGALNGATTNQVYSEAVNASGGSGSGYVFTVNGTPIPTDGSAVTISDSITVSNTGGNTLSIGGTPTTTGTVTLTNVTVKDSANDTAGPDTYTIAVNPPTPLTLPLPSTNPLQSGNINQQYFGYINASGGSGSNYAFTVNGTPIPTTGAQTAIPNSDGLSGANTGGNTLSISGTPTTPAAVTLSVTVTDSASDTASQSYTFNIVNPAAGYTVSGTVSYGGTKTGWIYLKLNGGNCGNCDGNPGTAISAPGPFTIHGVQGGTYTLQAWMDNTSTDPVSGEVMGGYGAENASNPAGVSGANVTVSTGPVSGASVTLIDPSTVTLGSATPTWDSSNGLGTFNGGAVVSFDPITNNNGIEMPNSYIVQWNTSSSFTGTGGSQCFPATGSQNPWIVSGISGSGPYYFRAAGVVGSCNSGTVGSYSAASPAITVAAPASGNLVQGTVTFSQTATGPLYVGFYNQNTGSVYVDVVGSKASPPASGASYSVYVPTGSNYVNFAVVDQKNEGLMVPGDISNTNEQNMPQVAITAAENIGNLALPSGNGQASVKTQSSQQTNISGSTSTGYNVDLRVVGLYKLPASVQLYTAPAYVQVTPADIATGEFNGNYDEWDYYPNTTGGTPTLSDVFTFNVTYTDGSSNSTANPTPNPLTASPTAILSAFATGLSPTWNTNSVSTTPTFTWSYPSGASSYTYQFQLEDSNYNTIWQIPGNHSNSNGFSSSISPSITWGVDPTGGGNTPSVSSLNSNSTYMWSIQATDAYGNEAITQVAFQTPEAALSLPAPGTQGSALVGAPYGQSIHAKGGSGSGYVFTVNGDTVPASPSSLTLTDGLSVSSDGNTLTVSGTPATVQTISLSVSVTDSQSNTAGPVSYSINVISAPSGVNNGNLSGTYVCKFDGFRDSDGSRWATLASFLANGSARTFTSGVFDSNSRTETTAVAGTMTGNYSVGADNNGVMITNVVLTSGGTGSASETWAIALTNATSPAQEFRMVETDDVGSSSLGQHSTADCYLATTGAFAASTLSGNSFAYGLQGEDAGGLPEAWAGRFTASTESATGGTGGAPGGSITNGIYDGMYIKKTSDGGNVFTGSYTAPSSTTGRFTIAMTQTVGGTQYTGSDVGYIIDANRMFLLETVGDGGMQAGDMRTQLNTSTYTASDQTGSSVTYEQGWEYSGGAVSGYDSLVLQATGNGTGSSTVNASYQDENGTYQDGQANGATSSLTFDSSNLGRATVTVNGSTDTMYAYFFNTGSAFQIDFNGSEGYLATGWTEPQTATTFTDAAVAGNYLFGQLPRPEPTSNGNAGEFDLSNSGNVTGGITTAGVGDFSYDESISMTYSWDPTVTGTGSFLVGSGSKGLSCIVISSTKDACIFNGDDSPSVAILQQ